MLETEIKNAFAMKTALITIFFDIEKAFDTTWRRGILEALRAYAIKSRMNNFINQTFKRKIF